MTDPFLLAAIEEAERGLGEDGIPIGSVLVHDGAIVGRGHNRRVQRGSTILHAEMDALENAGRRDAAFLPRVHALHDALAVRDVQRRRRSLRHSPARRWREPVVHGEEQWLASRGVQIRVIQDARCIALMREFMQRHPALWAEDIGE